MLTISFDNYVNALVIGRFGKIFVKLVAYTEIFAFAFSQFEVIVIERDVDLPEHRIYVAFGKPLHDSNLKVTNCSVLRDSDRKGMLLIRITIAVAEK